jgi:hypothetical protein
MYDPIIGLFTTADIIVQNFSDPPILPYVDPSGHFFGIDALFTFLLDLSYCGVSRPIGTLKRWRKALPAMLLQRHCFTALEC